MITIFSVINKIFVRVCVFFWVFSSILFISLICYQYCFISFLFVYTVLTSDRLSLLPCTTSRMFWFSFALLFLIIFRSSLSNSIKKSVGILIDRYRKNYSNLGAETIHEYDITLIYLTS